MVRPGVLVVEDDPRLLHLLQRVLERAGYAVTTASDGRIAARLIASEGSEAEVAVLDAAIAPHGARPLMTALRAARPEAAIVLVSGDRLEPDLCRPDDGRCVFLPKPFAPDALLRAIGDARARGAARGTLPPCPPSS